MIVEFIGASGAGKSSLARGIIKRHQASGPIQLAWELVLKPPILDRISHPTARNLVAEASIFPALVRNRQRYREFARFAARTLSAGGRSRLESLNYARSIYRKLGMHEISRSHSHGATILADEGTILTAYYLFVYSRSPIIESELERFAELVPLPDRVVYVTAPVEYLVSRAMTRRNRRRELASLSPRESAYWLQRAVEVFGLLAEIPPIRERVLVVESAKAFPSGGARLVDTVVDFLNQQHLSNKADREVGT